MRSIGTWRGQEPNGAVVFAIFSSCWPFFPSPLVRWVARGLGAVEVSATHDETQSPWIIIASPVTGWNITKPRSSARSKPGKAAGGMSKAC